MSKELEQQIQVLQAENQNLRQQLEQKTKVAARALASYQQRALHMEIIRQQNEDLDQLAASLTQAKQQAEEQARASEATAQRLALVNATLEKEISERQRAEETLKQNEALLRTVIDSTPDWIFIKDQNHRYRLVNKSYAASMHLAPEDFVGKNDLEIGFPEDIVKGNPEKGIRGFWADDRAVMDSGQTRFIAEEPAVVAGQPVFLSTVKVPLQDAHGQVGGVLGFVHDITERKQAEKTLQRQQEFLTKIIENLPVAVFTKDAQNEYRFSIWNAKMEELFGVKREAMLGKNDYELFETEAEADYYRQTDVAVMEGGQVVDIPLEVVTTNRGLMLAHTVKVPIYDGEDKPEILLGILDDITERKRAEEDLLKFKLGIERSNDAFFLTDPEGVITYVNPAFEKIYGFSREEAIGRTPRILKSGLIPQDRYQHFWTALLAKKSVAGEIVNKTKDGRLIDIAGDNTPILDEQENIIGFLAVHRDITEHKRAEEALRQSETRNRVLLNAIPDLIIRYRADGTYLDIKPSKDFQAFRPPRELIGKNLFEVAPPEVAQQRMHYIQLALQTGQPQTYEHNFTREGETRFEEVWMVPSEVADEVFVVIRDITERRRAEETLRQNETLLRTIIDNTPDWILIKDREHRFRLVNQSFADSVHLTPADLLGKTDLDLGIPEEVVKGNPEKGIRGFWTDDLEVMNSGQTKFIAEEPTVIDGQPAFLSTVKSPLRDANGQVWGLLIFIHNITERKQAELTLARRAAELQAVAQVGTATATILETDKLLQEVVDLTKGSFGLYHTHIYLLNAAGDTLVLAAGAGEVGRQMVAQGWSIPLERERSLVAQAARTRQGVVANDVRQAPDFLPNPLLPDTRAEMAVPLMRGDQLLGVLDVQADAVDYFSAEHMQIQAILAGQIAAALQNARSFAEQQQTQLLLSDRVKELNCLNEIGREIAESPPVPELLEWVTERIPPAMRYPDLCQAAVEYEGQIYGRPQAVELPCQMTHALRISGEVLGRIYIAYTAKQEFLDEESALIGGIASRLSAYIESRRLLEQVQDALAAQEHLTVELDSQRRMLQAVLDNMPAGVFVAEAPSGKPLLANEQVKQLLGRGIALDVNKKETAEMFATYRYGTDTLYPPDQTPLARGLLGESITIDDMEVRRPNGRRTLLQVVGAPIRNAQGSVSASVAIFQDVTERKQAEEVLRRSQEQLSGALETAKLAYWEFDVATQTFTFNDQFYSLLRTSADQEGGYLMSAMHYAQKFVHPDDAYMVGVAIQEALETTDPNYSTQVDHRVIRADGSEGYFLVRFRVVKDEQGRTIRTIGANQDITERKQAEETLRQNEALLRTVIDSTPDWIFIKDQDHRYHLVNQSYANSMHMLPEDFVGKNDLEIGFPEEIVKGNPEKGIKGFWADDREVMDSGETKFIAEEPAVLDGQAAFLSTIKVPLRDAKNQVWGVLGFVQNITERKQAELERERLLAEVEAAYRQYVQREWEHYLGEQHQGAMRIEHQAVDDLASSLEPAMLDAKLAGLQDEVLYDGKTKVVAGVKANGHSTEPAIVAPIALRGQIIGTLSLQDLILDRQWTAEEVALVETVSEQLALTVENLRLFDDTQKQATREQLTRQITDKMRAEPKLDAIIQTGLTELAKALNVSRAYVKLSTRPDND